MLRPITFLSAVLFFALSLPLFAVEPPTENWPMWRGPRGDGTSLEGSAPTRWNGVSGQNVAWKVEIPGKGHSSPIIWGERIFVVTCLEDKQERMLLALDRKTGKTIWQQKVLESPLESKHGLNSFASGTPATDGKLVYVTFLAMDGSTKGRVTPGEMIVAAYDLDGNQKWLVKPGHFASMHGFCSSPVPFEETLLINGDHDGDGYIVALDKATGKQVWKTPRPNNTRSYVTPIVRELAGRTQMILSGSKSVASYDPRTGREIWYMDGPTEQFVASMVCDGERVFLTAGFPEYHILAINPDGKGHVGDEKIVWRTTKGAGYVPSPILCGKYFLNAADVGTGSCFEAASGDVQWTERMGKHYSASLLTAGGLVYFLADDGVTKVVRPGEKLEVVAENELGESCYASPAISHGQLFIRGERHLFCIGK